jgi:hypothetical protein
VLAHQEKKRLSPPGEAPPFCFLASRSVSLPCGIHKTGNEAGLKRKETS